jgi:hypothetical protein
MRTFRVHSPDGKHLANGVQFGNDSVAIEWLEGDYYEPQMFDSLEEGLPEDATVKWDEPEKSVPRPTYQQPYEVFCPHCCTTSRVNAP